MQRILGLILLSCIIILQLPNTVCLAQEAFPIGPPIDVNTFIDSNQMRPSVSALTSGGFVVVWQSRYQDGSDYGVYGHLFNSFGTKVGSEFQVNAYSLDDQRDPYVASLDDGRFLVVWASDWTANLTEVDVYGQIFLDSGDKVGSEFKVNTFTDRYWRDNPSVGVFTDSSFIVVWDSWEQDGSSDGVFGQLFNSSGSMIGSEFQVNTHTFSNQRNASVATFSDNGFVVVWQSWGVDEEWEGIAGQIFDSSGAKIGAEFQVNTYSDAGQISPSVAAFTDDSFVVVWESSGQDTDSWGIFGQRFESSGAGSTTDR